LVGPAALRQSGLSILSSGYAGNNGFLLAGEAVLQSKGA